MNLFYDTETTGLINFKARNRDPSQPHLVQLAALLTDNHGVEIQSFSVIIEPDGYEIPKEASDIHGITNKLALQVGIPLSVAVYPFYHMKAKANLVIGHNEVFDWRVMKIACLRIENFSAPDSMKPTFCTMQNSTKAVNLPPSKKMVAAGMNRAKPPRLSECYEFFFGEKLDGAHDAMVDTRACARVYFHLLKIGVAI